LSSNLFLPQVYSEKKEHSKPPVSLLGQLLWREFYYVVAAHTPNYHRMEGNPICKQIPWDDNEDFYRAWEESRTGYPWIDAIMAQLRRTGWMHHLARHCVVRRSLILRACSLCVIHRHFQDPKGTSVSEVRCSCS
jgi:deoxyribodipyrimidine photolyase